MRLPDDIELSFQFRELARLSSVSTAWAAVGVLWAQLAAQAHDHRNPGAFERKFEDLFWQAFERVGLTNREALFKSHFLKEDGEYFFCQLFQLYNPELAADYVPTQKPWQKEWDKFRESLANKSEESVRRLHPACWLDKKGNPYSLQAMQRIWALVSTLDIITIRKARTIKSVTPVLVQTAAEVVSRYSEVKLSAILRRFLAVSRPKLRPDLPKKTEGCLLNFEDVVVGVMPRDGFVGWARAVEIPPDYAPNPREEMTIRNELLEANRIRTPG